MAGGVALMTVSFFSWNAVEGKEAPLDVERQEILDKIGASSDGPVVVMEGAYAGPYAEELDAVNYELQQIESRRDVAEGTGWAGAALIVIGLFWGVARRNDAAYSSGVAEEFVERVVDGVTVRIGSEVCEGRHCTRIEADVGGVAARLTLGPFSDETGIGDSGGPAFDRVVRADGPHPALTAVLSAGVRAELVRAVNRYAARLEAGTLVMLASEVLTDMVLIDDMVSAIARLAKRLVVEPADVWPRVLETAYSDDEAAVQLRAAIVLLGGDSPRHDASAVATTFSAGDEPNRLVVGQCGLALLGQIEHARLVASATDMLDDLSPRVLVFLAESLGRVGAGEALLRAMLRRPHDDAWRAVVETAVNEALARIESQAGSAAGRLSVGDDLRDRGAVSVAQGGEISAASSEENAG